MILAVVGTGTGVGKTHVAAALVRALRARGVVAGGWKPVESGVEGEHGADELALRQAGGAVGPTLRLREPLAPNVAARAAGVRLDGAAIARQLGELAARWPVLVLELAGGLFSPFDDALDNAEWLAALPATLVADVALVLVAPDRLGVLHDVSSTLRAGRALGLWPRAVALSRIAPEPATGGPPPATSVAADVSVGRNAAELSRRPLTAALPVVTLPHMSSAELSTSAPLQALVAHVLAATDRAGA